MKGLNKLKKKIRSWGGDLVCLDSIPASIRSPFSFDVALDYEKKIIYYSEYCDDISEIIHEAGHVFATTFAPKHLNKKLSEGGTEYDFLGWEFAMFKWLGLSFKSWVENNRDYSVSEDPLTNKNNEVCDLKYLSKEKLKILYKERLRLAKRLGIVSKRGVPLSVR